jgi:hypothetical protein
MIGGRLVKTVTLHLWQKLCTPSSCIVIQGTFLQTDAHSDELWLVYPKVLDREEGRHTRVTS